MRKSAQVPLLLLGIGSLAGYGKYALDSSTPSEPPLEVRRNYYSKLSDCTQEWGYDSNLCSVSERENPYSSGLRYYSGPSYYWDRQAGYPVAVRPNGETQPLRQSALRSGQPTRAYDIDTTPGHADRSGRITLAHNTTARGGFGSSAHSFSGGG